MKIQLHRHGIERPPVSALPNTEWQAARLPRSGGAAQETVAMAVPGPQATRPPRKHRYGMALSRASFAALSSWRWEEGRCWVELAVTPAAGRHRAPKKPTIIGPAQNCSCVDASNVVCQGEKTFLIEDAGRVLPLYVSVLSW